MKKTHGILKCLAVLMISVIAMALLGGCGSDKFEGHWIGTTQDAGWNGKLERLYDITIEKNGKGYLVKETDYYWNVNVETPLTTTTSYNPWADFDKDSKPQKEAAPQKPRKVTLTWETGKTNSVSANAKNNDLVISQGGLSADTTLTYIEKDDTLQFNFESFNMGAEHVKLHKAKDGELDEWKNKVKEELQNKYNSSEYTLEVKEK
ncbi:hypothetical protein [Megasphaera sp.]|uniref:hypothetical protein n=1 Tax=Megasphaera sp. TaxID=2023260 RepID=UPI00257E6EA3|nr:hypothetical protein [Megasphaera sp.]